MPRAGLDSEAVVSAAAELSDAAGLEAVTLARLAEHLGVRAPSLYVHIDGLSDLHRRLGTRGARELAAALSDAATGRSQLDALRAIAREPGRCRGCGAAPGRDRAGGDRRLRAG